MEGAEWAASIRVRPVPPVLSSFASTISSSPPARRAPPTSTGTAPSAHPICSHYSQVGARARAAPPTSTAMATLAHPTSSPSSPTGGRVPRKKALGITHWTIKTPTDWNPWASVVHCRARGAARFVRAEVTARPSMRAQRHPTVDCASRAGVSAIVDDLILGAVCARVTVPHDRAVRAAALIVASSSSSQLAN